MIITKDIKTRLTKQGKHEVYHFMVTIDAMLTKNEGITLVRRAMCTAVLFIFSEGK